MKLALIVFAILTSLSLRFGVQEPTICRGRPLPITILPGPTMQSIALPLRFGGERPMPLPWVHSFPSKDGFRLVIRNRNEFSDFWQRLTAPIGAGRWVPPVPEIDFSKEMIIVAAMGVRPSPGYAVIIDGACEVDGHVEVFVTSIEEGAKCGPVPGVVTAPADAVRIPQTDLPIVFREIQLSCTEWQNHFMRPNQTLKTWR